MSIQIDPPAETELRAKRLVIRCGTVEITSNGMGVGTLTVDGVEMPHSEITFTSKVGAVDELIIRTNPRRLSKMTSGTRASPIERFDPPAAIPTVVEIRR